MFFKKFVYKIFKGGKNKKKPKHDGICVESCQNVEVHKNGTNLTLILIKKLTLSYNRRISNLLIRSNRHGQLNFRLHDFFTRAKGITKLI